jgi:hypothetical protein
MFANAMHLQLRGRLSESDFWGPGCLITKWIQNYLRKLATCFSPQRPRSSGSVGNDCCKKEDLIKSHGGKCCCIFHIMSTKLAPQSLKFFNICIFLFNLATLIVCHQSQSCPKRSSKFLLYLWFLGSPPQPMHSIQHLPYHCQLHHHPISQLRHTFIPWYVHLNSVC